MKRVFKILVALLVLIGIVAASISYIKTSNIAVLEPKGIIGAKEKHLIITSSELMLIVVIPVLILTLVFAWRYREGNLKAKHTPDWEHNSIAEYCWWGVPLVIISILAVITYKSSHELNPFKPLESDKKPVTIQVVALQWKWLFIYPEQGVASVNYVAFPVNTPVNFEVTSDAPMNSFWIPQLGGQIYAMPAMRSKLHLMANEPGSFRGLSSNISGKGFAGMTFTAFAGSDQEFDDWISRAQQSAKKMDIQEYNALVEPSENNPVETYILTDKNLFDEVLMKYMAPAQ
jgi:cytochrome o ubiquinol oxidase subunit 2